MAVFRPRGVTGDVEYGNMDTPTADNRGANKKYVDDQIAAIPEVDVSGKADTDLQNIDTDLTDAEKQTVRDRIEAAPADIHFRIEDLSDYSSWQAGAANATLTAAFQSHNDTFTFDATRREVDVLVGPVSNAQYNALLNVSRGDVLRVEHTVDSSSEIALIRTINVFPEGEDSVIYAGYLIDNSEGDLTINANDITAVTIAAHVEPTNGNVLVFDDGVWVPQAQSGGGDGTTVVANPGGSPATQLTTVTIGDTDYSLPSGGGDGTTVTANPGGTGNADLTSIGIGGTNYDLAGGLSESEVDTRVTAVGDRRYLKFVYEGQRLGFMFNGNPWIGTLGPSTNTHHVIDFGGDGDITNVPQFIQDNDVEVGDFLALEFDEGIGIVRVTDFSVVGGINTDIEFVEVEWQSHDLGATTGFPNVESNVRIAKFNQERQDEIAGQAFWFSTTADWTVAGTPPTTIGVEGDIAFDDSETSAVGIYRRDDTSWATVTLGSGETVVSTDLLGTGLQFALAGSLVDIQPIDAGDDMRIRPNGTGTVRVEGTVVQAPDDAIPMRALGLEPLVSWREGATTTGISVPGLTGTHSAVTYTKGNNTLHYYSGIQLNTAGDAFETGDGDLWSFSNTNPTVDNSWTAFG